jgi:hypothetical protein
MLEIVLGLALSVINNVVKVLVGEKDDKQLKNNSKYKNYKKVTSEQKI